MVSFFANIVLGAYIFYRNPRENLNRLYALVTFSLAVWSLGNFLFLTSTTPEEALRWDKLGTVGSSLTVAFLLHFFLVFTRRAVKRGVYILFLYLPLLFFVFIDRTTNLIVESTKPAPWGYAIVPGVLYVPYTVSVAAYTIVGLLFCYAFYSKTKSSKEKIQAKLLLIAVSAPLVVGIVTEIIPGIIGFEIFPLASTLSTITAVIIAYAMVRYGLMAITPEMAAENIIETLSDYLIVVDGSMRIALANRSVLNGLGKERGEVVGSPLSTLPIKLEGLFRELESKGFVRDYEVEILGKGKKRIPVSVNASVVKDRLGGIIGSVLIMRDISYTKELIDNLEESKRELEGSKKKLEENVRELERFNKLAVGRELKMVELKKKIEELEGKLQGK